LPYAQQATTAVSAAALKPAPSAKAASLPPPNSTLVALSLACRILPSGDASDRLPPPMPDIFWIGLGIALFGALVGFVSGARSRSTGASTGLAVGAYLGVMAAFPLLAIGLATS
jgi:hypothetical protein